MQGHPSIRNELLIASRVKRRRLRAVIMALFLGPLGLFYTDPFGGFFTSAFALIMLLISPVAAIVLTWIGCIAWAVIAVNKAYARYRKRAPYFSGRC
jgi:hypothetical protein